MISRCVVAALPGCDGNRAEEHLEPRVSEGADDWQSLATDARRERRFSFGKALLLLLNGIDDKRTKQYTWQACPCTRSTGSAPTTATSSAWRYGISANTEAELLARAFGPAVTQPQVEG